MPWHRSSRCEAISCVEVVTGAIWVHVRDSAQPAGPYLTFGARQWQRFVDWAATR